MGGITKPQLRGLFMSRAKKHFVGAAISCVSAAILYKYLYLEPKQQRYFEFVRNYDDKKILDQLNEAGLMQSYRPNKSK